jgi:hypothetical protein
MSSALLLLLTLAAGPSTTNNDDSCDIGPYPAATLLLPYFEVETSTRSVDTFFTVTNVSSLPQIAHVTVWTDWSFPVLTFNLFLTGYDVQSISLYDVIVNGIVAPTNASLTAGGTTSKSPPGALSAANGGNPNLSLTNCDSQPGILPAPVHVAMFSALVTGVFNANGLPAACGSTRVGSSSVGRRTPTTAAGYVTIDVTSKCSPTLPTDPTYFTSEILYDNVLIGDYATLDKTAGSNYAGGNPLVHIRAVPEGGAAGATPLQDNVATTLPYTFYGHLFNKQTVGGVPTVPHSDRRQPLPSTFAARFIQGGPSAFSTDLKIWREGIAGPVTCANASSNSFLPASEVVRFDEHENPNIFPQLFIPEQPPIFIVFPPSSRISTASSSFPPFNSPAGDIAGWLYLNLDSGKSDQTINTAAHPAFARRASQNFVVVSMTGAGSTAGLFGVEFDGTSLGNGCSPPAPLITANGGNVPIGPAGGTPVCPPGFSVLLGQPCVGNGTNVNP